MCKRSDRPTPPGDDAEPGGSPQARGFAVVASACVHAGNACLHHCLRLLADGDTSMGDCGRTVAQMLPVCEMIGFLASAGSKHIKTAAQLCRDVCTECAAACEPHAGHHAECKACLEACEATVAEANKILV